jgi:hypothetical protein
LSFVFIMVVESFRLVTSRLIPRHRVRKQSILVATLILAGCGGSAAPKSQSVSGPGFSFEAPAGWKVERAPGRVSATHGSELVQVASFPLLKPYSAPLFDRVAKELAARMGQVAQQVRGTVSGTRTVTASGIRSHSYEVRVGDRIDEYTFVLRGLHESQLLCVRGSSGSDSACKRLIASFALKR